MTTLTVTESHLLETDPIFAAPTPLEVLLQLEKSLMDCVELIKQQHQAGKSAMRTLQTMRRCLPTLTTLALHLPNDRGPVVALLRAFIGATQWETRYAQQHERDPLPSIILRIVGQVQLARLALVHAREQARAQKPMRTNQPRSLPPTPARGPPGATRQQRHH